MIHLADIFQEVREAVNEIINVANEASPDGFIAYVAGGDYYVKYENTELLPFVLQNMFDFRKDLSRQKFYVHYLNKNYKKEGFDYEGEKGIDFLTIELMIYAHLWQSNYYLKHLVRLAHLACGKDYDWKLDVTKNIRNTLKDEVINPIIEKGLKIGQIVENSYYPVLRDSFAHGLYSIDESSRRIDLYSDRATAPISFEEFQKKFLYSIILSQTLFESYRENQKLMAAFLQENHKVITLPDGHRIKVESEIKVFDEREYCVFRPVLQ